MFQRLNKIFLGDVDLSSDQEPEFSEKEDEEWVLVDFIDTCPAFSVEDDDNDMDEEDIGAELPPNCPGPAVFSCLPSLECLAEASESCFLPLEESWFITPPPCFTARGATALKVETSPLENLLIEHPSMSVYAVHGSCPARGEVGCIPEDFPRPGSPRVEAPNTAGRHLQCYVTALAAAPPAFLGPPKSFRPSQWSREPIERLNRNHLRRQNLTRECHSRHARPGGWTVHQPCPRQYNY